MVDIKAELPKESTGRLVDALTDIIRPFSETRGLRADQIRLQREEVLIEIAKKARARLEIDGVEVRPIGRKFLVQFLERASSEEDGTVLLDWWAALLSSASKEKNAQRPIFVDFLATISRLEAELLEELWGRIEPTCSIERQDHPTWKIAQAIKSRITESEAHLLPSLEFESFIQSVILEKIPLLDKRGIFCIFFEYPNENDRPPLDRVLGAADTVDVCESLGLLRRIFASFYIYTPWIGQFRVSVEYIVFSDIGQMFMQACHPHSKSA
jgi:hypothetical protein